MIRSTPSHLWCCWSRQGSAKGEGGACATRLSRHRVLTVVYLAVPPLLWRRAHPWPRCCHPRLHAVSGGAENDDRLCPARMEQGKGEDQFSCKAPTPLRPPPRSHVMWRILEALAPADSIDIVPDTPYEAVAELCAVPGLLKRDYAATARPQPQADPLLSSPVIRSGATPPALPSSLVKTGSRGSMSPPALGASSPLQRTGSGKRLGSGRDTSSGGNMEKPPPIAHTATSTTPPGKRHQQKRRESAALSAELAAASESGAPSAAKAASISALDQDGLEADSAPDDGGEHTIAPPPAAPAPVRRPSHSKGHPQLRIHTPNTAAHSFPDGTVQATPMYFTSHVPVGEGTDRGGEGGSPLAANGGFGAF
jgi:hypothetical protein